MLTTSENSKPAISCIYVNYHSEGFLERSLESLVQYEIQVPFEVIIVNNDETEKTEVAVLGKKYGAKVVENFHNPGFGTAANRGAEEAEAPLLFFINPDTEWRESFFAEVSKKFAEEKNLGALGIQLISPEGIPETRAKGKVFTLGNSFWPFFSMRQSDWLSGGALFIPANIFHEIGGFDERFFMYFEDMDLCVRLQKIGYKLALHTEQQLIHFGGKSHSTKKSQKSYYDQSLYKYTKKHWSAWQHHVFHLLHPVYRFLFPYGRK